MYTTINKQNKDYENLTKNENHIDFINTFKQYHHIIIIKNDLEYKYKKFKDYYIRYCYHESKLESITYFNYSGERHRENGPAYITYYNGKISTKIYYSYNYLSIEYGPSIKSYIWKF